MVKNRQQIIFLELSNSARKFVYGPKFVRFEVHPTCVSSKRCAFIPTMLDRSPTHLVVSQEWVKLPDKIPAAYLQSDISEAPPNIQFKLATAKIGRAQWGLMKTQEGAINWTREKCILSEATAPTGHCLWGNASTAGLIFVTCTAFISFLSIICLECDLSFWKAFSCESRIK